MVVVTHDDAVAERAGRVIHLMDGLIDQDIRNGNGKPESPIIQKQPAVDLPPLPGETEKPVPAILTSIKFDETDLPPLPKDEEEDEKEKED